MIPGTTKPVWQPRLFGSCAEIRDVYDRFLGCSLPAERWTHEAHLAVAICLGLERRPQWVSRHMPAFIRRFNESVGTANDERSGFHATITEFFVQAVARYLRARGRSCLLDLTNALIQAPAGRRDFPLQFYSSDILFSIIARLSCVEPDLKPLKFTAAHFRPVEPRPDGRRSTGNASTACRECGQRGPISTALPEGPATDLAERSLS